MMVPVHQLVPIIGAGGAECCPPAPEKVLTCAGKAADLFHSGSSSCRFVLLMPLVLSTDDAFCHSGLDPESLSCPWTCRFEDFSTPPAASLEMTKDLSFRPNRAPCHFDRAERVEKSVRNFCNFFKKNLQI